MLASSSGTTESLTPYMLSCTWQNPANLMYGTTIDGPFAFRSCKYAPRYKRNMISTVTLFIKIEILYAVDWGVRAIPLNLLAIFSICVDMDPHGAIGWVSHLELTGCVPLDASACRLNEDAGSSNCTWWIIASSSWSSLVASPSPDSTLTKAVYL